MGRLNKVSHSLHLAADAASFSAKFAEAIGTSVPDFVGRFARMEGVLAIVLGGSLSMRLGTGASDIDFLVLLRGREDLVDRRAPDGETAVYRTFSAEADPLVEATYVTLINGIEIDLQFIPARRVRALCDQAMQPGSALMLERRVVLSRICHGWLLFGQPDFHAGFSTSLQNAGFEIQCAVRDYLCALKAYEDARAAVDDCPALAIHLARLSIENCFRSYLAARGYPYLGAKWLRLVQRLLAERGADENFALIADDGMRLLFPSVPAGADAVSMYHRDVRSFAVRMRALIERDRSLAIAFAMCPHIDPALLGLTGRNVTNA